MDDYDDEEVHFCNKCNSDIQGIKNYVRHRSTFCCTDTSSKSIIAGGSHGPSGGAHHLPPEDVFACTSDLPETSHPQLNADAFFSCLELQSSAKIQAPPRQSEHHQLLQPETSAGTGPRRSARQKERRRRQDGLVATGSQKERSPELVLKEPIKSPPPSVVADLDDFGIPALTVFSDLKPESRTEEDIHQVEDHHEHQHHQEQQQQQQQQQHKPPWLARDKMLSELATLGPTSMMTTTTTTATRHSLPSYDDDEYPGYGDELDPDEDSSAESAPDQDDESGDAENTSSDSDNLEASEHDYYRHHHHHHRGLTGGKWRPDDHLLQQQQQTMARNEDDGEPEEQHPPPSFTGGKWMPPDNPSQKVEESSYKDQPPQDHTQGKWVPEGHAEPSIVYWCSPCERRFVSVVAYKRHQNSDLHARRSIRDIDGAPPIIVKIGPVVQEERLTARQKNLKQIEKEIKEIGKKIDDAEHNSTRNKTQSGGKKNKKKKKKKRHREAEYIICELCQARVRKLQMGKHLLSYYHCRVAGAEGNGGSEFILKNIGNVVRQCPFQCSSCRFYCNTQDAFMKHWQSNEHKERINEIQGIFYCSICEFRCETGEQMKDHLVGKDHQDWIFMVNRSVPIVIRCQRIIQCPVCHKEFRYNLELRQHAKLTSHHLDVNSTASDHYQGRIQCDVCRLTVWSMIAFQRHKKVCNENEGSATEANGKIFFCSLCSLTFDSAEQVIRHRRGTAHKEVVKSRNSKPISRKCPHCTEIQANMDEHKAHIIEKHREFCPKCPKCGKMFALSQGLTSHTRRQNCLIADSTKQDFPSVTASSSAWKCSKCPFSCDDETDFLYHRAIHSGPVKLMTLNPKLGTSKRYRCPVCKKIVGKLVLLDHVRQHTGAKPFRCEGCSKTFSRKVSLKLHSKRCCQNPSGSGSLPGGKSQESEIRKQKNATRERKFVCDECQASFHNKYTLRQHIMIHEGKEFKCGLPGCPTALRSRGELERHRRACHPPKQPQQPRHQPTQRILTIAGVILETPSTSTARGDVQLNHHRGPGAVGGTKQQHQLHSRDNEANQASKAPSRWELQEAAVRCQYKNCTFRTKSTWHLKRHERQHTGKRPYNCRHCNYASSNLENLRKHVLSTKKHPGKMIYECSLCPNQPKFETNFTKELRAHLLDAHPSNFPRPNDVNAYIANIFDD